MRPEEFESMFALMAMIALLRAYYELSRQKPNSLLFIHGWCYTIAPKGVNDDTP